MLAAARSVLGREERGGLCGRTNTGQITQHCILLRFCHGVQTKITLKTLLRDGGANKCRVVAIRQQSHGNGQRGRINPPVILNRLEHGLALWGVHIPLLEVWAGPLLHARKPSCWRLSIGISTDLKASGKPHAILHGKEKVDIELPLKISPCKLRRHRTDRTVVWSRVPNPGDSPAYSKLSVTSDARFPPVFLHI
jgi:hypothetical protein